MAGKLLDTTILIDLSRGNVAAADFVEATRPYCFRLCHWLDLEPQTYDGLYIDSVFDRTQRWIWTADKGIAEQVWYVDFNGGGCCYYFVGIGVGNGLYVRAVRSG